jgi:hypothetical protein
MAERREDVCFKSSHDRIGMPGRLANGPPRPPLESDILKTAVSFTFKRCSLLLLRFGLSFTFAIGLTPEASNFFAAK